MSKVNRRIGLAVGVAVAVLTVFGAVGVAPAHATVISVNFNSTAGAVGANTAGVVPVGNWNDIPQFSGTTALQDSSGNSSGLSVTPGGLSQSNYSTGPANFGAGQAGNTAMMTGIEYFAGGNSLTETFTGTIPYGMFDVYVYYNAGLSATTQTIEILNSSGGSLGLSQIGSELSGNIDAAFVLSTGVNDANYVRFAGLTSGQVPANFLIRATGISSASGGGPFGYVNGLQIAEVVAVPEPSTVGLLALGACLAWRRVWGKR